MSQEPSGHHTFCEVETWFAGLPAEAQIGFLEAGDAWEQFERLPFPNDFLDIFATDDEATEPHPEDGDFWGMPDENEEI